ncbi:MAG TPA: EF-hand domain-containing protein [Steroidobacteraceae bacterium]
MSGEGSRFSPDAAELRREFKRVDRNHDGKVNFEEFKEMLEGLEAGMSDLEMRIGFSEVDQDKDGLIDQQEFAEWWASD